MTLLEIDTALSWLHKTYKIDFFLQRTKIEHLIKWSNVTAAQNDPSIPQSPCSKLFVAYGNRFSILQLEADF